MSVITLRAATRTVVKKSEFQAYSPTSSLTVLPVRPGPFPAPAPLFLCSSVMPIPPVLGRYRPIAAPARAQQPAPGGIEDRKVLCDKDDRTETFRLFPSLVN